MTDDGKCHLPSCRDTRVTETLCARHCWELLGRRPVEVVEDAEDAGARREAA